jgi:hypothetical protein
LKANSGMYRVATLTTVKLLPQIRVISNKYPSIRERWTL